MFPIVLGARRFHRPQMKMTVYAEFAARHSSDFPSPLSRNKHQPQRSTVWLGQSLASLPESSNLCIVQNSLTFLPPLWSMHTDAGIGIDHTFFHQPGKKFRQECMHQTRHPISRSFAATPHARYAPQPHFTNNLMNVVTADLADRP